MTGCESVAQLVRSIISIFYLQVSYITEEESFELGVNWFTCLEETMSKSRSALVVLTPALLRENWKRFQIDHSVCTQIEQHNFKVVFLLCEKLTCLGNLPKDLKLFLQHGATVERYKKNWKIRLIYELKTTRSQRKKLTLGNTNFLTLFQRRPELYRPG